ncbi:MAG: DUF4358 domain-containing protein [Oscillospiraceae bacterium]
MTKKFLPILLIFTMMFAFSACGADKNPNPSTKNIADEVVATFTEVEMSELSPERLGSYYDVDTDQLEEFSVYIEGSGGFAEEVAVFKVKSDDYIDDLKEIVNKRIENRKKVFENYNSEELVKIEANTVTIKGKYLFFVISDDNTSAEKIFNDAFKK